MSQAEGHALFDELCRSWLLRPSISRSTMMGFPCLRVDGQFFASVHRDGGQLIVKLPRGRVEQLVAVGLGEHFAPNGRVFREWVAVPLTRRDTWAARVDEAHRFVGGPA